MSQRISRRGRSGELPSPKPGTPPGTLLGDPHALPPKVHVIAYGPDGLVEHDDLRPDAIRELRGQFPIVWVNVDGLKDHEVIRALGDLFGLHPLSLEDVVHVNQRPKVEQYEGFLYLVLRMVSLAERLESEQVSLFLGQGFCVTFQETYGDCLDPVRRRLRSGTGRLRRSDASYLAYALVDAIIDHYFPVLEAYGERLEQLEDDSLERPDQDIIRRIHAAKRELLTLRRAVWPLREALNTLVREEMPLIAPETRVYLRDCYDHTVRVLDIVETDRELAASLVDIYLSSLSNRMNEVMKVLTIISTIFIPLSFIAGIYGMNFDRSASPFNMPELGWAWGYPFALGLMGAIGAVLMGFFYKRGWLSRGDPAGAGGVGDGPGDK